MHPGNQSLVGAEVTRLKLFLGDQPTSEIRASSRRLLRVQEAVQGRLSRKNSFPPPGVMVKTFWPPTCTNVPVAETQALAGVSMVAAK